jgi:predicted DNA-binding transcriptional regulator YafY
MRQDSAPHRRARLLQLLTVGAFTSEELEDRLHAPARTVRADLAWLRQQCPSQCVVVRGGDARSRSYRLEGLPPVVLSNPIEHLTHDEVMALIAARGLLRAPHPEGHRPEGWERPSAPYGGDLSTAVHGLLERAGLAAEARLIAPSALSTSRFAVAADPPGAVGALLHALNTGSAVRFRYRARGGEEKDRHVLPLRLVFIRGEAHVFAWSPSIPKGTSSGSDSSGSSGSSDSGSNRNSTGAVRQFRVSRIQSRNPAVRVVADRPAGCPERPDHSEVDAMLATGFNATGSANPTQRCKVVVAIHDDAWPDVVDRCWGESQRSEPAPDLGPHWRRLSFWTSGLPEARGWILSLGAAARPEAPPELITWYCDQCQRMVSALTPIAATQSAGIGDRTSLPTNQPT